MSKLIVFNWKENPTTREEAISLAKRVQEQAIEKGAVDVVVAPPSVFLSDVAEKFLETESPVKLGAQDVSLFEGGSHTGEISPAMLKDLGVSYCIVGHSERRAMGETDEVVSKKIHKLLEIGIVPILCVGEPQKISNEDAWELVRGQLEAALSPIKNLKFEIRNFICAYEPVWAIGGDKEVDSAHADAVIERIYIYLRDYLSGSFVVLYGGSVGGASIGRFSRSQHIGGFLVGSASLVPSEINSIIEYIYGKR